MVAALFGAAIDDAKVRIFNRCYLPFGLQPKNCAMTPNGSLYFHHSCYLNDYSKGAAHVQHWFMHEMVHVWQHQLGYPVRLRGALRVGLGYRYRLRAGATLADFNMEAQGDLLADYFFLKHRGNPHAMRWREHAGDLALFEHVLSAFLADPSSRTQLPRSLPHCMRRR
ncbi:MAG: Rhs element Vgr protein [Massilia sp.]|nr:Rhs element Vgr protein [Massilia sp.]